MVSTPTHEQRVQNALRPYGLQFAPTRVEALSTLDHSYVARVVLGDGRRAIFKQAPAEDFAQSTAREFIINRGVLSKLPEPVAPGLMLGEAGGKLPWLLFEDIGGTHQPLPAGALPEYGDVEKFVIAVARTHSQSAQLDLAGFFADLPGRGHVTDGSEHAPGVLDRFLAEGNPARFPNQTSALIARIRDNVPKLIREFRSAPPVLVHGDAHFGNALYNADGALLLDWAMAVMGPGEVDLCHALAMNLPRSLAREYEPQAIRAYTRTCSGLGYPRDEKDVLERYRVCLLMTVVVAVSMGTVAGMPDAAWAYLLTNAVEAAIDHDAMAFLG